jgi:hypothetical protein
LERVSGHRTAKKSIRGSGVPPIFEFQIANYDGPRSEERFENLSLRSVQIRAHEHSIKSPVIHQPASMKHSRTANSRCFLMIVPQKSAQPVATSHWVVVVCFADPMEQQLVVLTLVISLCMIVPAAASVRQRE